MSTVLRSALPASSLEVSQIRLDAPYVRLHIAKDQSSNFQALLIEDEDDAEAGADPGDANREADAGYGFSRSFADGRASGDQRRIG